LEKHRSLLLQNTPVKATPFIAVTLAKKLRISPITAAPAMAN
jgi:hypothetical protein